MNLLAFLVVLVYVEKIFKGVFIMKRQIQRIIASITALAAVICSLSLSGTDFSDMLTEKVEAATYGVFEYDFYDKNSIIIKECDKSASGDIIIPETIEGFPVTRISYYAFYKCSEITSIVVPEGVTFIERWAFSDCTNLKKIELPSTLKGTGFYIFDNCINLEEIIVDKNNKFFSSESGVFFSKDKSTLLNYPAANKRTAYYIPQTVEIIDENAFEECRYLENITFPNNLIYIYDYSFHNCKKLKSIHIPMSVDYISATAFLGCSSLVNIEVDELNEKYSNDEFGALYDKNKTVLIQYPIGNERNNFTVPHGVTKISGSAFSFSNNLVNVFIPDSVTEIEENAFFECTALEKISVGQNNNNYSNDENGILFNKDKTDLVLYPANNPKTTFNIPNGTKRIDDYEFYKCSNLEEVTIPNSVTYLGEYAFSECSKLKNIEIPGSVYGIECLAFSDCSSLSEISIKNGVVYVASGAFWNCENLSNVFLPESVEGIGYLPFGGCKKLEGITVDESNKNLSNDRYGVLFDKEKEYLLCFPEGSPYTDYVIPDSVQHIDEYAFNNCNKLESLTIPGGDLYFYSNSFINCNPKTIYYKNSRFAWEKYFNPDNNEGKAFFPDSEIIYNFSIRKPSTTVINYKDSIYLHADFVEPPTGEYTVSWFTDNKNFSLFTFDNDSLTAVITAEESGSTTIWVSVYDEEKNICYYDEIEMTSRVGLWQKILAFFKSIFGMTKIIPESLTTLCK